MFSVITDTSGNLPTELLRERGILAIPFYYYIEGQEYSCEDTATFDGPGFYQAIREGAVVNTSQINPQRYTEVFEAELQKGLDVIFVSMSSGISGSCNSAGVAARELMMDYPQRRIEIVDTAGASLGEGFVALHAAQLRDEGVAFEEAVERLRDYARSMANVFTVEDLMHLKRTGRLSNLSAIVGTVLNIKPLLKGDETGHIVSFGKLRGRRRSVEALAEIYNARVVNAQEQTVGIAHADCGADAQLLAQLLQEKNPPKAIAIVDYEPVTGSHVGPGALALFFQADEEIRSVRWPVEAREIRLPVDRIPSEIRLPVGGSLKLPTEIKLPIGGSFKFSGRKSDDEGGKKDE